jgi:hypothetical protein
MRRMFYENCTPSRKVGLAPSPKFGVNGLGLLTQYRLYAHSRVNERLVVEDRVTIEVGRSVKKENSYSVARAGRAQWYTSAVISGGKT